MEKPSSLSCSQIPEEISGIFHFRRLVSRDRQILVMEMKAGNPSHVAYLLIIF